MFSCIAHIAIGGGWRLVLMRSLLLLYHYVESLYALEVPHLLVLIVENKPDQHAPC